MLLQLATHYKRGELYVEEAFNAAHLSVSGINAIVLECCAWSVCIHSCKKNYKKTTKFQELFHT